MPFLLIWKSKHRHRWNIFHSSQSFYGKRITLTPQNLEDSPSIGLFYDNDKEEFKDAVSRLLAFQCPERFSFGENAQDYVFALTDGYPGAVTAIVNVLLQVYVNKLYTSPLFISLASFVTLFECPRNGAYWEAIVANPLTVSGLPQWYQG